MSDQRSCYHQLTDIFGAQVFPYCPECGVNLVGIRTGRTECECDHHVADHVTAHSGPRCLADTPPDQCTCPGYRPKAEAFWE